MPSVLVLNGPNLNMLGVREPVIYGVETLGDIEQACSDRAHELGLQLECRQSNHEGEMVTIIQDARAEHEGIVINAGAYAHTSVAIQDALRLAELPVIEVHLSNVYQRESFRHRSYIAAVADGLVCGLGAYGYLLALDAMAHLIEKDRD